MTHTTHSIRWRLAASMLGALGLLTACSNVSLGVNLPVGSRGGVGVSVGGDGQVKGSVGVGVKGGGTVGGAGTIALPVPAASAPTSP